jgi:hypothetical protein
MHGRLIKAVVFLGTMLAASILVYHRADSLLDLPNRIPEAAPYVTEEAEFFPPPFEEYWRGVDHPGQCQSCHQRIFAEWSGSMMANAWRDPAWRGAFLLTARQTSTRGDCDVPAPPDGTAKARLNPFSRGGECASGFDLGGGRTHVLSRPGSLLDAFCARCHMPSNYIDNVPLHGVAIDESSGREDGAVDANFNPTSDAGTGIAFATYDAQLRNTESGKSAVFCAICHSIAETRDTPYHSLARAATSRADYVPVLGVTARSLLVPDRSDLFRVPDETSPNLGYAVGSGSFRLSPHAIGYPERLGPLAGRKTGDRDRYLEGVFREPVWYDAMDSNKHQGYHNVLLTRAEVCSSCHDVTNPLTIMNAQGRWVGGFPIERTYSEWLNSQYADRPGNRHFQPAFKRDCQTCHMQQDYGQPGTAQSLYDGGVPRPPARAPIADGTPSRIYFSHHFVGGNSYIPRAIGAAQTSTGAVQPYPKLSIFSFTSKDEQSPYHNAYWTNVDSRGPLPQQARLAWDRLRNVLDVRVAGPAQAAPNTHAPLTISVANTGSGHKFPTGFPEGRIAWLAVRAFDLGRDRELDVYDSFWKRTSRGVGDLTQTATIDPSYPRCAWTLPPGSVDPYAIQFKAVASLGDGCPTLDLAYAHPLNLVTNAEGLPIDRQGRVIDRRSPNATPQFRDLDGDGDVWDDAFLSDTRLDPLPSKAARIDVDRYAIVIPSDAVGPVAVTVAVYYQSVEAVAALKLLGNLADTDGDLRLEPCVLDGLCDGRVPSVEPAVVEGSPPVTMEVRNLVIQLGVPARRPAPTVALYPADGSTRAYLDAVPKVTFSEPVSGVDATTLTLRDSHGEVVPAWVDQIGDSTWALFPHAVFLRPQETYHVRVGSGVCGVTGNCLRRIVTGQFTTAAVTDTGQGDTSVPRGFPRPAR